MKLVSRTLRVLITLSLPCCGGNPAQPTPTVAVTPTTSSTSTSTSTSTSSTSTSTTTTVPASTGAVQFDGAYRGTFSGTFSGVPVSGPVSFTASNGRLTVTDPADGTGTVDGTGAANFGGTVSGLGTTCSFSGTFAVTSGVSRANGPWNCGSSGSGTWTATRN